MTRGPVVILGGSGFLGRRLEAELARRGRRVVSPGSRTLDLTRPEAVEALAAVAGEDATLVMAAALTPDKGQTLATFETNVAMASTVARFLQAHRVQRCVHVGSDAAYGFEFDPVTEATPVAPGGYYAMGKYVAEKLIEYAGAAAGIGVLSLRPAGIYGPGDPHGSYGPNSFARTLAAKRMVRMFGAGEERRDHIHVDDVARVIAACLETDLAGVLNVATGESRSFGEVVDIIKGLVPYEIAIESAPRRGAITHRHYDIRRLREALPDLRFTPLADGLRGTLAAFNALGDSEAR